MKKRLKLVFGSVWSGTEHFFVLSQRKERGERGNREKRREKRERKKDFLPPPSTLPSQSNKTLSLHLTPGCSLCSSKQKHCTLLKCAPACCGATLYVDTPVTAFAPRLRAVKKASADCPGRTTTARWAGEKRQGRPSATSALKVTVISRGFFSPLFFFSSTHAVMRP